MKKQTAKTNLKQQYKEIPKKYKWSSNGTKKFNEYVKEVEDKQHNYVKPDRNKIKAEIEDYQEEDVIDLEAEGNQIDSYFNWNTYPSAQEYYEGSQINDHDPDDDFLTYQLLDAENTKLFQELDAETQKNNELLDMLEFKTNYIQELEEELKKLKEQKKQ